MDVKEIMRENVEWIDLAKDMDYWRFGFHETWGIS
jgi:hypothetical protein